MKASNALLVAVVFALSATPLSSATEPLPSGSNVVFFIDTSGNVPEPDPGPPADMLVFTGGRIFVAELPDCSDSPLPLQDAVLVDRDGPRASRQVKVFLAPPSESVPPGTRLKDFSPGITCTSGGVVYRKYTGTVE